MATHWNSKLQRHVYILQQSDYYLSQQDELINTVLGSCIAVCLRDNKNLIGGMNHFLLPVNRSGKKLHWPVHHENKALRYGDISMELLVNGLIKQGAKRENLEAKIFGGSAVLPSMTNIGRDNIRFVKEYLELEGIPLIAEDVGGRLSRKIFFDVKSGDVLRQLIPQIEEVKIKQHERKYIESLDSMSVESCTYYLEER